MNNEFLLGSKYCDLESPVIQRHVKQLLASADIDTSINIFNRVRDDVKYAFDYWRNNPTVTLTLGGQYVRINSTIEVELDDGVVRGNMVMA